MKMVFKDRLLADAQLMSVNKSLVDVTTVLEWAHGAEDVREKIEHITRTIEILSDLREQLEDLR